MSNASTGKTVKFTLDLNTPLGDEAEARLARLAAMPDSEIDFSDIPELSPEFWKRVNADDQGKAQITLRLDRDVLDYFRDAGKRYQTRINSVLRAYVHAQIAKR